MTTIAQRMRDAAEEAKPCNWYQDDEGSYWHTSCNHYFTFEEDDALLDGVIKFCMYCGKPINAEPWTEEQNDD